MPDTNTRTSFPHRLHVQIVTAVVYRFIPSSSVWTSTSTYTSTCEYVSASTLSGTSAAQHSLCRVCCVCCRFFLPNDMPVIIKTPSGHPDSSQKERCVVGLFLFGIYRTRTFVFLSSAVWFLPLPRYTFPPWRVVFLD